MASCGRRQRARVPGLEEENRVSDGMAALMTPRRHRPEVSLRPLGGAPFRFFDVMEVCPLVGREFLPGEASGQGQVVVSSQRLWREGSAPTSRSPSRILLDQRSFEVVGVMPTRSFPAVVPGNRSTTGRR